MPPPHDVTRHAVTPAPRPNPRQSPVTLSETSPAADDAVPPGKACPQCPPGTVKPLAEFGPDSRNRDGRRGICKECVARQTREARAGRARLYVVVDPDPSPARPGPDPDTSWYEPFLDSVAANGNVSGAAARVGIHRDTVYAAVARDPLFAQYLEWARNEASEPVWAVAWARGVDGWEEDVWRRVGGVMVKVGTRWRYDRAMLRLILQTLCPEYRLARPAPPAPAPTLAPEVLASARRKVATVLDNPRP
jgi:hypothetical protein